MKAIYALLGSSTILSSCAFLEALGESIAETPNVAAVAGETVTAVVEGASSGGGAVGAIVAAGSVLANVIAGIAIRTINKMKKEPSRAAPVIDALEARLNKLEGGESAGD